MITIDGSYGTGGGQILRTALGLAAITGKACKIEKIRAKRKKPGLREQHLQGALALSSLCNAKCKGLKLDSTQVEFYPQAITKKHLDVNIRTAGSIGLVLQALMIPSLQYDLTINIKGGATFGKSAPPLYYIKEVLRYFLNKIGYRYNINIKREGFFPKGGAIVEFKSYKPNKLEELTVIEQTPIIRVAGISVASVSLKQRNVAERQAKTAIEIPQKRFKTKPIIDIIYSNSISPGSGLQLWIETENSRIGASSFGRTTRKIAGKIEKGITSEDVAREAIIKGNAEYGIKPLIWEYENGIVDSHAADQLLPYLALSGGSIKTSEITEHVKTNISTIEKFLPVKFSVKDNVISVKKSK